MSFNNGTNIVTDSLVYCLDAANVKCYSGSGTNLVDLKGNSIGGTLGSNMTVPTNNSNVFKTNNTSGGNDATRHITLDSNFGNLNDGDAWSLSIWVRQTVSSPASWNSLCGSGGGAEWWTCYITNATDWSLRWRETGSPYHSTTSGTNFPTTDITNWNHFCTTVTTGRVVQHYINGVKTLNSTTASSTEMDILRVFSGYGIKYNWCGEGTLFKIYEKTLSDAEVLQNYDATRGRFV
tara:strand:- start:822 stop:1529 length:708 start_codon:yes stop_codon:yes gene_type:complete